jgi:hypothetical protein
LPWFSVGGEQRVAEAAVGSLDAEAARGVGFSPPPPAEARVPLPGGGVLSSVSGEGDLLALTSMTA